MTSGCGVGDRLEVDAVGLVEQHRGLGAELVERVLDPRQHAVAVVVAPRGLAHADRDDAEGERNLVIRPRHGRDALRLRLDRRLAVGVLDRDGEAPSAVAGGRSVGAVGCAGAGAPGEGERGDGGRGDGGRGTGTGAREILRFEGK